MTLGEKTVLFFPTASIQLFHVYGSSCIGFELKSPYLLLQSKGNVWVTVSRLSTFIHTELYLLTVLTYATLPFHTSAHTSLYVACAFWQSLKRWLGKQHISLTAPCAISYVWTPLLVHKHCQDFNVLHPPSFWKSFLEVFESVLCAGIGNNYKIPLQNTNTKLNVSK